MNEYIFDPTNRQDTPIHLGVCYQWKELYLCGICGYPCYHEILCLTHMAECKENEKVVLWRDEIKNKMSTKLIESYGNDTILAYILRKNKEYFNIVVRGLISKSFSEASQYLISTFLLSSLIQEVVDEFALYLKNSHNS